MESKGKVSAKDFFIHLGAFVSVYVLAGSFISLVFATINQVFPGINRMSYYYGYHSGISMQVATIVVIFPVMIVLFKLLHQSYAIEAHMKDIWVRRWLTYVTMFVAGIIWLTDLITIIYKFLDGQEFTTAFLLKALTFLLVAGFVFYFYLEDLRGAISADIRQRLSILVGILLLASIVCGFFAFGSPRSQRMARFDEAKIAALQNLQYDIENTYRNTGVLPDAPSYTVSDPQTGRDLEYLKINDMEYSLCANFNRSSDDKGKRPVYMYSEQMNNWSHGVGQVCFRRSVKALDNQLFNNSLPATPILE